MISVRSISFKGQIYRAFIFGLLLVVPFLAGCYNKPSRLPSVLPSVLILAVENYGPETSLCSWESAPQVQSALRPFCQEAVEMKSLQAVHRDSVPAMASLLFGALPSDLKIENNQQFVTADFESYAEKFHHAGAQTAFFASTPLFMRRTGLAQGFDHFEETHRIEQFRWGRTHDQVIQSFLRWKGELGSHQPYYAVLTFSDLNFPWLKTTNLAGQERIRNIESQAEAIEEAWVTLFQKLNADSDWNNTWILVVGTQGLDTSLNPHQIYGAIRTPSAQKLGFDFEQSVTLAELSRLFHQQILGGTGLKPMPAPIEPTSKTMTPRGREEFWIKLAAAPNREKRFLSLIPQDKKNAWWALYEQLELNRAKEFNQLVAKESLPIDSTAYWDRVLLNRKDQTLLDTCVRMIDLKIFEGGGARTCDSPTLLGLQEWLKAIEDSSSDTKVKEARQKTLRAWHELKSIRQVHLLNRSLGGVLYRPLEIGRELLRTEMALRLPEAQMQKAWLDKVEPGFNESSD
ncbi:MAG: hypothetical protein ACK5P7_03900 [Bdellovibrio sp.]